jgi:carboxymethylenebutenolidase
VAHIELTARDGHTLGGATRGLVVIQEIFGVNTHIRSVVDRYATLGYHAVAPAVFDREERGVDMGYDAEGIAAGRALASALDLATTVLDMRAAVDHVAATGPVGFVGYCFGGTMAWVAANGLPVQASVGYYGGNITGLLDRAPQTPVMLHFGALDTNIPVDGLVAITERYPDVPLYIYDEAEHGFNCDARASYHAESAALALERSLAFFDDHLGGAA